MPKIPIAFLIFYLITSLPYTDASAQQFTTYNVSPIGSTLRYKISPEEENIDGSPYILSNWESAKVYTKNKTFYELKSMNYNAYIDEVIFKMDNQYFQIPNKTEIERIIINNKKQFIGEYTKEDNYSFLEVLVEGEKISLYKRYKVGLKKGTPSKGYVEGTNDYYYLEEDYYIKGDKNNLELINPRKSKSILKFMPDKNVAQYIKANNLKTKHLDDLIQIINYYNK